MTFCHESWRQVECFPLVFARVGSCIKMLMMNFLLCVTFVFPQWLCCVITFFYSPQSDVMLNAKHALTQASRGDWDGNSSRLSHWKIVVRKKFEYFPEFRLLDLDLIQLTNAKISNFYCTYQSNYLIFSFSIKIHWFITMRKITLNI